MKVIAVAEATYLKGHKLNIVFNDNKKKVVDFAPFLNTHSHPPYNKY